MSKNLYLEQALESIPRLLSLLNRIPYSNAYGSFDRSYWWYRKTDFPSAIHQQAVLSLAIIYNRPFEGNSYYQSEEIKESLLSGMRMSFLYQHRDGSYDEWYINERGWAGPTAYILYAQAFAINECRDIFSEKDLRSAKSSFQRAIKHLKNYEETDVLANHQALAYLAYIEAVQCFPELSDKEIEGHLWKRIESSINQEGWALEYDGVDLGYLTASLSFLSKAYRRLQHESIKQAMEKILKFMQYMLLPSAHWPAALGSRNTNTPFYCGLVLCSQFSPLASKIEDHLVSSLQLGLTPSLKDMDDHYFIYRVGEFLEAGIEKKSNSQNSEVLLPFENTNFQKYFSEAGLLIISTPKVYALISAAKGFAAVIYNRKQNSTYEFSGIVVKKDNRLMTANYCSRKSITVGDNQLSLNRSLKTFKNPTFSYFSFAIFRLVQVALGSHSFLSKILKTVIRKVLMQGRVQISAPTLRALCLQKQGQLHIQSELSGLDSKNCKLFFPNLVVNRFVPQSNYYTKNTYKKPDWVFVEQVWENSKFTYHIKLDI